MNNMMLQWSSCVHKVIFFLLRDVIGESDMFVLSCGEFILEGPCIIANAVENKKYVIIIIEIRPNVVLR